MPPAPDAKRGDPDRPRDRLLAPALGGQRGAPSAQPLDTQPSERVDDGKPLSHQAPAGLPLRRLPRPNRAFRAAVPPAKLARYRRPDGPPPRAASVAHRREAWRAGA